MAMPDMESRNDTERSSGQFTSDGFTVDCSGPNDHGDYLVSTWKPNSVGPTGVGLTPELAISHAWIRYVTERRVSG